MCFSGTPLLEKRKTKGIKFKGTRGLREGGGEE